MNSISIHDDFYESEPGIVRWKTNRYNGRNHAVLNIKANDLAGCINKRTGRWCIKYKNKSEIRARIVWMLHNGNIPEGFTIDHINCDKTDDKITNLRLATKSENTQNAGKRTTNTSGYKGVTWLKSKQKWQAQICVNSKNKYLGLFENSEKAYKAYCDAAKVLHGQFCNLG